MILLFKLQNVLTEEIKWHIDRRPEREDSRQFLDLIQLKVCYKVMKNECN